MMPVRRQKNINCQIRPLPTFLALYHWFRRNILNPLGTERKYVLMMHGEIMYLPDTTVGSSFPQF
jgi:hypothetical protein